MPRFNYLQSGALLARCIYATHHSIVPLPSILYFSQVLASFFIVDTRMSIFRGVCGLYLALEEV